MGSPLSTLFAWVMPMQMRRRKYSLETKGSEEPQCPLKTEQHLIEQEDLFDSSSDLPGVERNAPKRRIYQDEENIWLSCQQVKERERLKMTSIGFPKVGTPRNSNAGLNNEHEQSSQDLRHRIDAWINQGFGEDKVFEGRLEDFINTELRFQMEQNRLEQAVDVRRSWQNCYNVNFEVRTRLMNDYSTLKRSFRILGTNLEENDQRMSTYDPISKEKISIEHPRLVRLSSNWKALRDDDIFAESLRRSSHDQDRNPDDALSRCHAMRDAKERIMNRPIGAGMSGLKVFEDRSLRRAIWQIEDKMKIDPTESYIKAVSTLFAIVEASKKEMWRLVREAESVGFSLEHLLRHSMDEERELRSKVEVMKEEWWKQMRLLEEAAEMVNQERSAAVVGDEESVATSMGESKVNQEVYAKSAPPEFEDFRGRVDSFSPSREQPSAE